MTAAEKEELLIRLDERVEYIHLEVCGNGKPGLKKRMARLEKLVNICLGVGLTVGFVAGVLADWKTILKHLVTLL